LHGCCCGFIKNPGNFRLMLREYTDYRLKIHRLTIKIFGREDVQIYSVNAKPEYGQMVHYESEASSLRKQLRKIWPCVACIHLYNPTNKYPRSLPQLC